MSSRKEVDTVEDFIRTEGYVESATKAVKLVDFYKKFHIFCKTNRFAIKGDSKHFVRDLEAKGFKTEQRGKGGYKHVYIEKTINENINFKLNDNE